MSDIQISGLTKRYGNAAVLQELDLTVRDGEFLTLLGASKANPWVAFFATFGVILSAAYALFLYRRVVFGDLIKESLKTITDLTPREKWIFAPLVAMTLLLGVYPRLVTDVTGPAVANLLNQYHQSLPAAPAVVAPASH